MARILVVDDDPQVRDVIRRKLDACDHEVVEAPDGAKAIRLLEKDTFDLLVLDIVMPEQDGLAVIMHLKGLDDDARPKVIAVSSPGNSLFLEAALGLGATRVLPKPFRLDQLADCVDELLAVES